MGIRHGDLNDTVLSKISIDEFEPKTGESKDVMVVGFNVTENGAGKDLSTFLNSSIFEVRDVEVSPNPNEDGYFMVFLELDRNENVFENVVQIIKDIENVSGKLKWKASTHLTDEYHDIYSSELQEVLITDPDNYMTREQWEQQMAQMDEEQRLAEEAELAESNSNKILEFLKDSDLLQAGFSESGKLTMMSREHNAQLEVINFGDADTVMSEVGIAESALQEMDMDVRRFNSMLGNLNAVKIDEYVVIFNTNTKQVLVGKPC